MKVIRTTATKSETSSTLDLFEGRSLTEDTKNKVREEVGAYLVEQSLVAISEVKSPVAGESIPALAKGPYRKKKLEELGNSSADLQNSGETLDALDWKPTAKGIKIGVFGDRAPVADGHNNFSGKSDLPRRRFLPGEDQNYRAGIQKEVDRIVADAVGEQARFLRGDFMGVGSRSELFQVIESKIGPLSKTEMKLFIYRNEKLFGILDSLNLLRFVE